MSKREQKLTVTRVQDHTLGNQSYWVVTCQYGCVGVQVDFQLKPTRKQIRHIQKWVNGGGSWGERYKKKGEC